MDLRQQAHGEGQIPETGQAEVERIDAIGDLADVALCVTARPGVDDVGQGCVRALDPRVASASRAM